MTKKEIDSFCPSNQKEWREWLEKNHINKNSVWLIYFKASSNQFNLSWSEAVDEALCFGWIDSTKKSIDEERFMQLFSKRKAKSTWSKINKDKVEKLTKQGLMIEAGLKSIEIAKQNGSWTILDDVEKLIIPKDLELELEKKPDSKDYFLSLSKSMKKSLLYWLIVAKKQETRQKRISEIVENAVKKQMPKQFR